MADKKTDKPLKVSTGDPLKDHLIEDMLDSVEAKTGMDRVEMSRRLKAFVEAAKQNPGSVNNVTLEKLAEELGTTTEEFEENIKRIAAAHTPKLH